MQTGVNHPSESFLSRHNQAGDGLLLCAAIGLPDAADDAAPEWVHLLPSGELRTNDGRGPYKSVPPATLILNSMTSGDRLPIDENHAMDIAAPKGGPSPARGWIVALEPRADGIWGRVEWTRDGGQLVASKAYRGISPVIEHRKDGTVTAIRRASLVNNPNLKGLTTLHQETSMDLLAKLLAALGLAATTSEETLVTAVTTLHASHVDQVTVLQAVAKAAGLDDKADGKKLTETVTSLMAAGASDKDDIIVSLQSELTATTTRLNTLETSGKRDRAEAFVDAQIRARKVGVTPLRQHYITRHMANAEEVEKELAALPSLNASHTTLMSPPDVDGKVTLHAEHKTTARLLGISEEAMLKTIEAEQAAATH